jgi:hypothetical protein
MPKVYYFVLLCLEKKKIFFLNVIITVLLRRISFEYESEDVKNTDHMKVLRKLIRQNLRIQQNMQSEFNQHCKNCFNRFINLNSVKI